MPMVMTRRDALAVSAALLLAGGAAWAQGSKVPTPVEIVSEIYRRAVRDKDNDDVSYPLDPKDRQRAFSRDTLRLWAAAEARTPQGDEGPINFDPVTNSQDSSLLRGFKTAPGTVGETTAQVVATMTWAVENGSPKPPSDLVVTYSFLLEDGRWKINDISGSVEGDTWSLRELLTEAP